MLAHVGCMLAHIECMLAHVGCMLAHVGRMLSHIGRMVVHVGHMCARRVAFFLSGDYQFCPVLFCPRMQISILSVLFCP